MIIGLGGMLFYRHCCRLYRRNHQGSVWRTMPFSPTDIEIDFDGSRVRLTAQLGG